MSEYFSNKSDAITHTSIVHDLLKKITVELSTKEFKGGYKQPVFINGITQMEYVPDSRAEYIQSVEALADIILPQFDKQMEEEYEEYEDELEKLEDTIRDKEVIMGDANHSKFTKEKLKLVRALFQRLNLLLKRINYLKAAAYTEEEFAELQEDE